MNYQQMWDDLETQLNGFAISINSDYPMDLIWKACLLDVIRTMQRMEKDMELEGE